MTGSKPGRVQIPACLKAEKSALTPISPKNPGNTSGIF